VTAKPQGPPTFPPLNVELGPQVPADKREFKIVTMTNASNVPVEVFSLDYDCQYKDEEGVLALADGYDDRGYLRVPVRAPGSTLSADLVRSARAKDPSAGGRTFPAEEGAGQEGGAAAGGADEQVPEAPAAASNSPRAQGLALNVVIVGPPGSGVSTQAHAVADALGCPVSSLDQAVRWARSGAGGADLAAQIRGEFDKAIEEAKHAATSGSRCGCRCRCRCCSRQGQEGCAARTCCSPSGRTCHHCR